MDFRVFVFMFFVTVFIVTIFMLIFKIKTVFEQERIEADRIARRHEANSTASDSFVNTTYVETESGIFPGAPPPYSHVESPPKYEDIIKSETVVTIDRTIVEVRATPPTSRSVQIPSDPPPYTISV